MKKYCDLVFEDWIAWKGKRLIKMLIMEDFVIYEVVL